MERCADLTCFHASSLSSVERTARCATSTPYCMRRLPVTDIMVSGDRVIVRGEATGTPVGEFFGARPTGKSFKTMALDVFTVRGDKLASAYHVENWVGAIQQIQR
jgi:predicted ester cyclase